MDLLRFRYTRLKLIREIKTAQRSWTLDLLNIVRRKRGRVALPLAFAVNWPGWSRGIRPVIIPPIYGMGRLPKCGCNGFRQKAAFPSAAFCRDAAKPEIAKGI